MKRKEAAMLPGMGILIPLALDTEEFRQLWDLWKQHRAEIRHRLTPTQEKQSLKRIAKWGLDRAISAIEYSLSQGYQGIFEESTRNGKPAIGPGQRHDPTTPRPEGTGVW